MSTNLKDLAKEFIRVVTDEIRRQDATACIVEGGEHAEFYPSSALPGMLCDDVVVSVSPQTGTVTLMPENNNVPVTEIAQSYGASNEGSSRALFTRIAEGFVELTGLPVKPLEIVDRMPSLQCS